MAFDSLDISVLSEFIDFMVTGYDTLYFKVRVSVGETPRETQSRYIHFVVHSDGNFKTVWALIKPQKDEVCWEDFGPSKISHDSGWKEAIRSFINSAFFNLCSEVNDEIAPRDLHSSTKVSDIKFINVVVEMDRPSRSYTFKKIDTPKDEYVLVCRGTGYYQRDGVMDGVRDLADATRYASECEASQASSINHRIERVPAKKPKTIVFYES